MFVETSIEPGAKVFVDGSVAGKIINRGGRLAVNHKATFVITDGPAESEACGVLMINLTAITSNWATLAKRTDAQCAAVVKANAYGCGIGPITGALAKNGCNTFFVSNIPEAKQVRAVAPHSTIYVLNGLYCGTESAFVEINAQPVINSSIELAAWDVFVKSHQWAGGCALNVDTGASRLGLSMEEAAALAPRSHALGHGITLLIEGAQMDGDVVAEELTIGGHVKGTLHANRVKLNSTAVVEGDIFHRTLAIEENARFDGMSRRQENTIDTSSLVDHPQVVPIDLSRKSNGASEELVS